jgi:hypothetical protein
MLKEVGVCNRTGATCPLHTPGMFKEGNQHLLWGVGGGQTACIDKLVRKQEHPIRILFHYCHGSKSVNESFISQ